MCFNLCVCIKVLCGRGREGREGKGGKGREGKEGKGREGKGGEGSGKGKGSGKGNENEGLDYVQKILHIIIFGWTRVT